MQGGSKRAVYAAIAGNSVVMVGKFIAFFASGSSAMLSEGIHSFADVSNQCLLALGIRRSAKNPDKRHPYGYVRETYIWALISAVGIFFLGCGVTVYHGIHTLLDPKPIDDYWLSFTVLAFAFVIEGATLLIAIKAVSGESKNNNQTFLGYIKEGSDPTGVAVILEDGVAVIGVLIAALGLYLTYQSGNPKWDSVATIIIGLLLGLVAIFITYRTKGLLVGQSIPIVNRKMILKILREDPVIEKVYDIKTAIMGVEDMRFKAEIEFDGGAISERYLKKIDINKSFDDLKTHEKRKDFLIDYGDHLIEALGDEINRIEKELKRAVPQLKHVDIEVN